MYGFFEDSIILIYRPVCLKKRKHIAWVINKKEFWSYWIQNNISEKKLAHTLSWYTSKHFVSVRFIGI